MKANIKAQWVANLRSGEFIQGKANLRAVTDGQERLCCLGVLCEQAVRAGVIPAPELHNGTYYYLDDQYGPKGTAASEAFIQASSLPRKVAEWAGLMHDDGTPRDDVIIEPAENDECTSFSAIEANDGVGMSFAEIADLIDKNVPAE